MDERPLQPLPQELYERLDSDLARALGLFEEGKHAEAIHVWNETWEALPEPQGQWERIPQLLFMHAPFCLFEAKLFAEIPTWIARGEAIFDYHDGGDYDLFFLKGEFAFEQGDYEEAFTQFDEVTRKYGKQIWDDEDPKYVEFYQNYQPSNTQGNTALHTVITPPFTGQKVQGGKALPAELSERVEILTEQAESYAEHEAYPESLAASLEALELLPTPKGQWQRAGSLYVGLADTLIALGQFHSAMNAAQYALDCGVTEDPIVWAALGKAAYQLGDKDEARKALTRTLELGGGFLLDDDDCYLNFLKEN